MAQPGDVRRLCRQHSDDSTVDPGASVQGRSAGSRSALVVVGSNVDPGEAFLDGMNSMVEGARRQQTPNEIALTILLVALTLVCLLAPVALLPYSLYSVEVAKPGTPVTITVLV